MTADNELTEKLRFLSGVLRTEGAINASDDVLRAAAEIVRLRREVARLEGAALADELIAVATRSFGGTIAPAEAKSKWAPPYPDAAKDPFNALLATPPAPVHQEANSEKENTSG